MEREKVTGLVRQAMQGSDAAFEQLCRECGREIIYMCTRLTGNRQDGEDAAQEVLLKLHKNLPRLREAESFFAWMNRTVYNTCSNKKRQEARKNRTVPVMDMLDTLFEENIEFLPEQYAEQKAGRQQVLDALDSLPLHYRQVLLLFYYQGMGCEEIAQTLGFTTSKVYAYLNRGRQKLRAKLEKENETRLNSCAPLAGMPVLARILRQNAAEAVPNDSVERLLALVFTGAAGTGAAVGIGHKLALGACTLALGGAVAAATIFGSSSASGAQLHGPLAVPQQPVATVLAPGADDLYTAPAPVARSEPQGSQAPGGNTAPETPGAYAVPPPPAAWQDATPPNVDIEFTGGGAAASGGSFINPQEVLAVYVDQSPCTAAWYVAPRGTGPGDLLAQGTGEGFTIDALGLPAGRNGSWYTVGFTVTDSAGNETCAERDFVLFGEK